MQWLTGRRAIHDAYAIHLFSRDPFAAGGTRYKNSTATACNAWEAGKILAIVENMEQPGKAWLRFAYAPEYSLADFRITFQHLWALYEQTDEFKGRKQKTRTKAMQLLQQRMDDLRFRSRCFFVDKRRDSDFNFEAEYSRPLHPITHLCAALGLDPNHFTRDYGWAWDFWKEATDSLDRKYLPKVSAVVMKELEARHAHG